MARQKNCLKCGDYIPCWVTIDGLRKNLGTRKLCLKCSPFGKHNTRPLWKREKSIKDCVGERFLCEYCDREYEYKGKADTRSMCQTCVVNLHRTRRKLLAIDYLGGKCISCGYDKNPTALDFHHRDEKDKTFTISQIRYSWEKTKRELDKCDLLCANCHRELHYEQGANKKIWAKAREHREIG